VGAGKTNKELDMHRPLAFAIALVLMSAASGVQAAPFQDAALTASGTPEVVTPEDLDDATDLNLQYAASVTRVDWVANGDAKLFGIAGGDPAMNGLNTYIGFFANPADGWEIFNLGDILDYTVLSSAAGRVDLDLEESTYDEAKGEIGARHRKVIVTWTVTDEFEPPTIVTVTPAQ